MLVAALTGLNTLGAAGYVALALAGGLMVAYIGLYRKLMKTPSFWLRFSYGTAITLLLMALFILLIG